jgi:hypothetical protein
MDAGGPGGRAVVPGAVDDAASPLRRSSPQPLAPAPQRAPLASLAAARSHPCPRDIVMADGDIVLAAVDPVGGGAVLVRRVTWSVAAAHLFHPFRRRDAPLLAGENPAFLAAEAQLDPGSQVPRSDRLPLALGLDAGAAMPRRGVVIPDHRLPGAFLLDAGAGAPRRGLIADTGAGAPHLCLVACDCLLGALPVAVMRHDTLLVVTPRGPTYLLAAPHGPRGQQDIRAALFGDALLAAPGDAAVVVLAPEAQVLGRILMAALGGDRGMAGVVALQLLGAAGEHGVSEDRLVFCVAVGTEAGGHG